MRLERRTAAGVLGIVATLLLHSLFFAAAIWGGGRHIARMPDAIGAGANTGKADGSSSQRMLIIWLPPENSDVEPAPTVSPQLTADLPPPSIVQVTGPDALPSPPLEFEEKGDPTEASDADLIARTKLAGLYESQIRARIERAWTQPSLAPGTPSQSCLAKIHQQHDGRVDEVTWDNCHGSPEWLDSLKRAIFSASPLPGAPHPSVFVDSFSMVFRAP